MIRCAVWGSPIDHSLSPALHRAAYRALGLTDWSYERREVDVAGFEPTIEALDDSWRGLSLTMPLKEAALAFAAGATDRARHTGAANTLVRGRDGWFADNTDVYGVTTALREAGCVHPATVAIIGSGATARSAVAAATDLGAQTVVFLVREQPRPETVAQARAAGLHVVSMRIGQWPAADVIVSTVPPAAVAGLAGLPQDLPGTLLDVVYSEGETPLQRAARTRGWSVVDGTTMLLHQACEQVRLMTGRPAPAEAMRAALWAALDGGGEGQR